MLIQEHPPWQVTVILYHDILSNPALPYLIINTVILLIFYPSDIFIYPTFYIHLNSTSSRSLTSVCAKLLHIRAMRAAQSTVSPYQSKETFHPYLLPLTALLSTNLYRLAVLPSFTTIWTRTGLHCGLCVSMSGCPGGFWDISCNLEIALRGIRTKGICMQHTKGRGVGLFVSVGV